MTALTVKLFTGLRQQHALIRPHEQRHSQFLFQRRHLTAERRLGHVRFPGGGGYASRFRDRHKVAQLS